MNTKLDVTPSPKRPTWPSVTQLNNRHPAYSVCFRTPCHAAVCLSILLTTGCDNFVIVEQSGANIEVTNTVTGNPISEVTLVSAGILYFSKTFVSPQRTVCAPTDSMGLTFVPIVRSNQAPHNVIIKLQISMEQLSETIEIERQDGEVVTASGLSLRIVQSTASVPQLPSPEPLVGVSPPTIRIGGYAGILAICSCANREPIVVATADNDMGSYADAFDTESIPLSFAETVRNGMRIDGEQAICPFALADVCESNDMFVFGVHPLYWHDFCENFSECFQRIAFCQDNQGEIVRCAP